MRNSTKELIKTTLILVVICTVTTAALAVSNVMTKDKIEQLERNTSDQAMQLVLPAESYVDLCSTNAGLAPNTAYSAYDSGGHIGNVFITSSKGYGGDVKVMTGVDTGGAITKIKILDCANETPGLGQNAANEAFTKQFSGIYVNITVKEDVDAITGATITSAAVADAVNRALALNKTLIVK